MYMMKEKHAAAARRCADGNGSGKKRGARNEKCKKAECLYFLEFADILNIHVFVDFSA